MYESTINSIMADIVKPKYEKLSEQEEKELIVKAKNGDKKAKERICGSVFRYVVYMAKNTIKSKHYEREQFEDLIMEGAEAVCEALDSFDFDKLQKKGGVRFITFANLKIWQRMVKYEAKKGRLSVSGDTVMKKRRLLGMIRSGSDEEYEEIAKRGGIRKTTLKRINHGLQPYQSLDVMENDYLIKANSEEDEIIAKIDSENSWALMRSMCSDFEMAVMVEHFGLYGGLPVDYKTLAKKYSCTVTDLVNVQRRVVKRMKCRLFGKSQAEIRRIEKGAKE